MAKVVLENVCKVFRDGKGNDVRAVDDVNLVIEDQEFMVFVGPSGCGKSTTLRMVAGLEEITAGTIAIDGKVVNNVPPKDRDIAMVFQNYALYPHMTVYKNMAFGLMLRKYPKAEIEQRVREAAEILGIEPLLDRKPKELSGGQRQRVAVGRAIVRKPKVFLFDEPLSNLDAKMRVQMRTEISKLHHRLSATMIYVTHDQVEAMTMGDRITVMNAGKIQQVDAPLSLYQRPANAFVAGFIGSPMMNFFEGETLAADGRLWFVEKAKNGAPGFRVCTDRSHEAALRSFVGRPLRMGLRSEDIHETSAAAPAPSGAGVRAKVEVVEPMGSEVYLYLATGAHNFIARVGAARKADVNHEVEIRFDMERAHFFDVSTEKAIA
ncbi:MAG: sn-glycerol-3-phosphate ABC transporter ATP-binding protein UgpC [Verrucomicrobiae bacterium]|nr:sn-glycerol-3-phosphate ABC transporter ATP-binding protein UgpC [Verrucomicrobiae bacterium]